MSPPVLSMKRPLAAALAAGLGVTLLMTACSGGSATKSTRGDSGGGPKTVTVAYSTDLAGWSPYAHSDTPSYSRWANVFEPLLTYDSKAKKYVPVLATDWKVDGTKWTFHLRHDVKFQSGNPFTSADVVHTFNRIKTDPDSLQAANLDAIASTEAPDDHTVVVTTKRPNATLISQLINTYISGKASYDKWGKAEADKHPDGTGPYSFVSWQPGVALTMNKNPNYWNKAVEPAGMPDKLVFKVITSPEDAVAALQRGEVDIDVGVPVQDKETVENGGAKFESIAGNRTLFFAFNNTRAPMNNKLVRQAISYAVDTKGIIDSILKGAATQTNGLLPAGVYGANTELTPYPHDPEKAKQMLAQAGATGAQITLTTPTNRYPSDTEVAQAVQQQLEAVGLKVAVKTPDFGTFSADLTAGKMDFYQISRGGFVDAAALLTQYFQSGITKRTQYSNPAVDDLLTQQAAELDETKRLAELRQAQALIFQDAPAVFFGSYNDIYGVAKRVTWQPNVLEQVKGIDMTVN